MSKLTKWLIFISVSLSIWSAIILRHVYLLHATKWGNILLFLPLISLLIFGLYAASVVLYRTFTFNDCNKEADELKKEIEEAKKDLRIKGILS